ncbi:MAG: hypothetical protein KatS3mg027_2034 [Bacteroidia bacterium]|nr:MAG: hypothetical protein KatS3mg027_2034 [Bacteroidia bacterium]
MSLKAKLAWWIIGLVLIIDQSIKIYIKLNYPLGMVKEYADWAYLYFTENPGMAFGIEWGGRVWKIVIDYFQIIGVWIWCVVC